MDQKTAETIIQLVKDTHPETVDQLVKLTKEKINVPETKIVEYVLQLENEGKIVLQKPKHAPTSFSSYLIEEARWYWATLAITVATAIAAFTIPEDAFPLVYVRYVLGTIFVLWLPGYSFVRALFPQKTMEKHTKNLDSIERVALSIGLSLALVPIVGLLLNYTPWGIRLTPIVLSLLSLTMVFAAIALGREYQAKT